MTTATQLVTYDHHQTRRDWLTIQNPAIELANAIAGTQFVPDHFRSNPAAIAAAILYGDEVGLGPMQSLAKIAVINGTPTLASEAQRALILRAGHDLWIEESTPTRCTVAGRRRGSEATSRITWTMDDAKRANLAGKPPWRLYPRQMLLARASAELARAVFPDAIGGLGSTEELTDDVVVAEEGRPEPTTRRRRANVQAAPDPPQTPALPPEIELPPPPADEPPPEPPPLPDEVAPAPPPEAPTAMISDNQRRKIQAMFRERAITDRVERLDYCTRVVGREITSANDLTSVEASQLIDSLDAVPIPGGPPDPHYASPEQREALFALRMEAGVTDARLREILEETTGQRLTAQIPADRYGDVVAAILNEAAALPPAEEGDTFR